MVSESDGIALFGESVAKAVDEVEITFAHATARRLVNFVAGLDYKPETLVIIKFGKDWSWRLRYLRKN